LFGKVFYFYYGTLLMRILFNTNFKARIIRIVLHEFSLNAKEACTARFTHPYHNFQ